MSGASRHGLLAELRERIDRVGRPEAGLGRVHALDGGGPLDRALPGGALPRAALHEVVAAAPTQAGAAAGFAASLLGRIAAGEEAGAVLWIAALEGEVGLPYPPGLAVFGLDPTRLLLLRVGAAEDALWAAEEAARSRALAAVLVETRRLDPLAGRRLQLAAEAGACAILALVVPRRAGEGAGHRAGFSLFEVSGLPGADFRISAWRVAFSCRGGPGALWPRIEWCHATHRFGVAAELRDRSDRARTAAAGA